MILEWVDVMDVRKESKNNREKNLNNWYKVGVKF